MSARIYKSIELIGLFGMSEIEDGMARIINLAQSYGVPLVEVRFKEENFDRDSFREMCDHGWVVRLDDVWWVITYAAEKRIKSRFPLLK